MSNGSTDIEFANTDGPANGFPSIAAKIAKDKDKTTTIYRRFDRLAARNLLYLQSRLQKLEAELDQYDAEDFHKGDVLAKRSLTSWEDFEENAKDRDWERKRMDLAMDVQTALKTYHEALLLHSKILKLEAPAERTLRAFKDWFGDSEKDNTQLRGNSSHILDDDTELIALRIPAEQDRLTKLIQNWFPVLFITEAGPGSSAYISEKWLTRFVSTFSTILAAILLVGAIVSLYYVNSPELRIALIVVFMLLFAGSVELLTSARRAEVFAATAAYAAVLVVFVSGNFKNPSSISTTP